jgi:lysophospholipase L1-like esterase
MDMTRRNQPGLSRRGVVIGSTLLAGAAAAADAQPAPSMDPAEQRLHSDWAWLARYREENAADAARPATERRVVFLGDSITEGWRAKRSDFFVTNGFIGRGISGQTSPQMLVRFQADVAALKPRAVHILAGTNDVAGNTGPFDPEATRGWITAIAELAKAQRIQPILGAIPPAADFPWRPGLGPAGKIRGLNEWMRGYAHDHGFVFADYTAVLDDGSGGMRPGLAYDGVHPTPDGYAAMEPVALKAAEAALRRPWRF